MKDIPVIKIEGKTLPDAWEKAVIATWEEWTVAPEYVCMSRNPGLGRGWYEKYSSDVFPNDEVVHEARRYKTPRYYDTLLERDDPNGLQSVKERRREAVKKYRSDLTPARLAVKERLFKARAKGFRREV